MRSVRSTGTAPEQQCEAILRSLHITFKRAPANLRGRPDFVLDRPHLAIFVHGCFWHSHKRCKQAALPSSNVKYWKEKIDNNRKRDRRVREALRKDGWRTAVIWECELKKTDSVARRLSRLIANRAVTGSSLRIEPCGIRKRYGTSIVLRQAARCSDRFLTSTPNNHV
jgi:DNA mismatch endonuclease, patch repair protein